MGIKALTFSLITSFFLINSPISAQTNSELDIELIDSRIQQLRESGSTEEDEILKAYQTVRNWLDTALSHERDTTNYLDALKNAPELEAEILAQVDIAFTAEPQVDYDLEKLSFNELEAQLALLSTQLSNAANTRDVNKRRLSARDTNAQIITERLDEIVIRLNQLPDNPITVDMKASPSLTEGSEWMQKSERIALNAEQNAQKSRLASQPARYEVLRAEQAKLSLQIDQLSTEINAIKGRLAETQLEDADSDVTGIEENSPIYKLVQKLVADRVRLRQQRVDLVENLSNLTAQDEEMQKKIRIIEGRTASIHRVVEFASDSDVIGNVLLVHWREIESYRMKSPTRFVTNAIGDTIIKRIEYEEAVGELISTERYYTNMLEEAGLDSTSISDADKSAAINLLQSIRSELSKTINLQSDYLETLRINLRNYTQFSALIEEYQTFVGSRVLWVPSHPPIYKANFQNAPKEIQDIYSSLANLKINKFSIATFFGLLVAMFLLLARTRFKEHMVKLNKNIGKTKSDSIVFTLAALGLIVARALPIPLVFWSLSGVFSSNQASVSQILSSRIQTIGVLVFLLLIIRTIYEENGVGSKHFNWYRKTCNEVTKEVNWWLFRWVPLLAASSFTFFYQRELNDTVLNQVIGLFLLLFIAFHLIWSWMALKEKWSGIIAIFKKHRINCLFFLLVVVLIFGSSMGYIYTVRTLIQIIIKTFWLALFLVLVYSLFKRWLLISQRKIRLAEYMAKLGQAKEGERQEVEDRVALVKVSREASELLNVIIITIGVMMLWYLWEPLLPALDALQRVTLWTTTTVLNGDDVLSPVTLNSIVIAFLIAAATIYTAGKLPALIELILRQRAGISASVGYTISTLLNYVILGAGFIIVLSALGLNWSKLQWLVAALGVGIGFGLQEIVANFISGLIILFERPIRVGDVVSIGDQDGTVARIRIRATTIMDWDGRELLVPNKEFITGRLLNWTLTDASTRIVINVGIAYGSDIEKALETLKQILKDHPRVLDDPSPSIIFKEFGDSTLNLAARGFIDSMENRIGVISELNQTVYKRFEEEGITIAFPQRDIHFDTENPIRVSIDHSAT